MKNLKIILFALIAVFALPNIALAHCNGNMPCDGGAHSHSEVDDRKEWNGSSGKICKSCDKGKKCEKCKSKKKCTICKDGKKCKKCKPCVIKKTFGKLMGKDCNKSKKKCCGTCKGKKYSNKHKHKHHNHPYEENSVTYGSGSSSIKMTTEDAIKRY